MRNPLKALQPLVDLRGNGTSLTPARARLLEAVDETGSIAAAARAIGMSYKGAWDAVAALNAMTAEPVVTAEQGGAGGGGAQLTAHGRRLLRFHEALAMLQERVLSGADSGDLDQMLARVNNMMLRTSARNQFECKVSAVATGAVNSEVNLQLDGDDQLVAIITNDSVRSLGLAVGVSAIALIKSSFIILAAGDGLRTSARNQLHGVVADCELGAVNSEVVINLSAGKQLVATVTNGSAHALELTPGTAITALVKASHVILAVAV